jgi:palmitoyltransferase
MVKFNQRVGLSWPPAKLQVVGWLVFAMQIGTYYGLLSAYFQPKVVLPCYSTLMAAVFISGLLCTLRDPSDMLVKPGLEHMVICCLCKRLVRFSSKHCSICNRCIAGLDHHCDWLNICIGSTNYRYFISLLVSLELLTSLQVVCGAVGLDRLARETYRGEMWVLLVTGLGVIEVCMAVLVGILGFLLCFHAYLNLKSMTLYEYSLCKRLSTARVAPLKYEASFKTTEISKNISRDSTSLGSKSTFRIINTSRDVSETFSHTHA